MTADLLVARLRVLSPEGRSYLIASPRVDAGIADVGAAICSVMLQGRGGPIDLTARSWDGSRSPGPPGPAGQAELREYLRAGDASGVRTVLASATAPQILVSDGLLERGVPVTLTPLVDGVVLVVREGRTSRADLPAAARLIGDLGGRLLLAAYVN